MLFIFLATTIGSCLKEPPPSPTYYPPLAPKVPDTIGRLRVVWQQPHVYDSINQFGGDIPLLQNNGSVIFTSMFDPKGRPATIHGYTLGGNKIWDWNDYLTKTTDISNIKKAEDGMVVVCDYHELYSIDGYSGQTKWKYEVPGRSGRPRIWIIGNYVYHARVFPNQIDYNEAYLMRSPLDHSQWDTVYTMRKDPQQHVPSFESLALWIKPDGDSVLVFQNRQCTFQGVFDAQIDFVAYNLHTRSEEFILKDIDLEGNSPVESRLFMPKLVTYLYKHLHKVILKIFILAWELPAPY